MIWENYCISTFALSLPALAKIHLPRMGGREPGEGSSGAFV